MPKVSIIVPNYNHAAYISRRLSSIYSQHFGDYEVIILDDASTDGSAEVISGFLDKPNTTFVPSESNSGSAFLQWKKGIDRASGEYLWIAESDDAASASFLTTLVKFLDADPKMGLAYSQSWMMDGESRIVSDAAGWTADLDPRRWTQDFTNHGRDEIRNYLVHKNTIPNASAVLMRRRALLDLDWVFRAQMRLCGDWLLWVKILTNWRVGFCAHRLNFWRQGSSNARVRIDGLLESSEGQFVIEEACSGIELDEITELKLKISFLERCLAWQTASVEKMLSSRDQALAAKL